MLNKMGNGRSNQSAKCRKSSFDGTSRAAHEYIYIVVQRNRQNFKSFSHLVLGHTFSPNKNADEEQGYFETYLCHNYLTFQLIVLLLLLLLLNT
jgi:hypothetical protein